MIATVSSSDVQKINEKILTYLIIKFCYNGSNNSVVRPCDVMDESLINSTDTPTCVEQIRCGMCNHLKYVSDLLIEFLYAQLVIYRYKLINFMIVKIFNFKKGNRD